MLKFAEELMDLASGSDVDTFVRSRVLCLAVEKLFINLGEAASRVGEESALAMPELPWRRVIGLRNILAHGYEQVAHEILHKTIVEDLPGLAKMLRARLQNTSH